MRARRPLLALAALALGVGLAVAPSASADPPNVSITGGPSGVVTATSATITFTVDDPSATVECSLDGGGFGGCSSDVSYSSLSDGDHTVTVRATNAGAETGSATRSWTVDTTGPSVSVPSGGVTASVNGMSATVVTFSASASEGTVSCSPASGSSFSLGTTTVTCSANDALGNTGSAQFDVVVKDDTSPTLTLPSDPTVNVEAAPSAVVTYTASAQDGPTPISPSCAPASGSSFPVGDTVVTCTATDAAGNEATGTFTVKVRDATAPVVSIGSGPSGTVASSSATFSFSTNEGTLACSIDGGSFDGCSSPVTYTGLTDGDHTFRVRATDAGSNATTVSRQWTVDASGPTFTTPGTLVVEANGPTGSSVAYVVSASDGGVALLPSAISCSPSSGSLFPLGSTPVTCQASDALGNVASTTFAVTVRDSRPPTLNVADITVVATTAEGIRRTDRAMAEFLESIRASDLVSGTVIRTDTPDLLPVGVTELRVTAVDDAGNSVTRTVKVTVLPVGQTAPPPPDLEPPDDVRSLKATVGDHSVVLTWAAPRASDVATIEVRVSIADEVGERVVTGGPRTRATFSRLRNDVQHRFLVVVTDKAGNSSRGVVVLATPRAALLALPKAGAQLTTPPLLRWAPVRDAAYFNVQLYRGTTKVLSAWPTASRLQLTKAWMYDKARRTLGPGTYTWYVWPGLGARRDAKYGTLLGKSTFSIVAGKKPAKTAKR